MCVSVQSTVNECVMHLRACEYLNVHEGRNSDRIGDTVSSSVVSDQVADGVTVGRSRNEICVTRGPVSP